MTAVADIVWRRKGRARTRTGAPLDRDALQALRDDPNWCEVAGLGAGSRGDPPDPFSADRRFLCLELDQQLSGAALLQPGVLAAELGAHPWSPLSERPELARRDPPPCETLLVDRLGWHTARADSETAEHWVRAALAGTCEQVGASRVVAPVPIEPPLDPAPYLQQLHFRAVEPPPALRPLFAVQFQLRGFYRPAETSTTAVAVLVWESPHT